MNYRTLILPKTLIIVCAAAFGLTLPCVRGDSTEAAARSSPEWLRDGVIYEIFPRDFSKAGNLDGVTAKLDDLHELGVNILWLMPIQPIGEKLRSGEFGSPYSTRDYYAIDPGCGTANDFKKLVAGAHQRGMKVIMDLVANHTAWDSVLMTHPDFYKHNAGGKIISPVPAWTDVAALDYRNPQLRRYMISMLKYWILTYNIDGFRCDSAGMVPTDFWEQVRRELMKTRPDIIMLAEASKPELLTNAFDIDYSWPMLGAVDDVIMKGAPASEVRQSWNDSLAQFPKGALHLRISDDHDEIRAVNRYGYQGALAASALMFTLDGVPLLYNGMEIGDANETCGGFLFRKISIAWQTPRRPEWRSTYRDLIHLRHQYPALCDSPVEWVQNTDEKHLVSFRRVDDKDDLLVLINFSRQPVTGKVVLDTPDRFSRVKISGVTDSDDVSLPNVHLNGFEWCIFHRPAASSPPLAERGTKENANNSPNAP
ncbi:MAG TPA: alpha-amylase family glycosyl hydrolase [Verrucomicrobiae bacterium]